MDSILTCYFVAYVSHFKMNTQTKRSKRLSSLVLSRETKSRVTKSRENAILFKVNRRKTMKRKVLTKKMMVLLLQKKSQNQVNLLKDIDIKTVRREELPRLYPLKKRPLFSYSLLSNALFIRFEIVGFFIYIFIFFVKIRPLQFRFMESLRNTACPCLAWDRALLPLCLC